MQTLHCGNTLGDTLVQVTPTEVRLVSAASKQMVHQWQPPPGQQINVAAGNASQVPPPSHSIHGRLPFGTWVLEL